MEIEYAEGILLFTSVPTDSAWSIALHDSDIETVIKVHILWDKIALCTKSSLLSSLLAVVNCPALPSGDGQIKSSEDNSYGDTVTLSCADWSTARIPKVPTNTPLTVTCQANKKWDHVTQDIVTSFCIREYQTSRLCCSQCVYEKLLRVFAIGLGLCESRNNCCL